MSKMYYSSQMCTKSQIQLMAQVILMPKTVLLISPPPKKKNSSKPNKLLSAVLWAHFNSASGSQSPDKCCPIHSVSLDF